MLFALMNYEFTQGVSPINGIHHKRYVGPICCSFYLFIYFLVKIVVPFILNTHASTNLHQGSTQVQAFSAAGQWV